ncbi:IS481 family transposase [Nocardia sp. NPDC049707]|uniref:IS481 family transposase n=1 Tax=Nocardia sp. NPDC049707 TaxID=3154735 RepID=UPI00342A9F66
MVVDQQALAEYRYRAVCEVLGGAPIGEVAARYGTTRQSLDTWRKRFRAEGVPGLADRSRRPHTSPTKLDADTEALICRMRREHPRWGARRIGHELARQGLYRAPSRATVHRVLTRNGMVNEQAQQHKRQCRRWQRQTPMHLWQLDIVGGVPLADGRECKLLTGIDDHSRFMVVAAVLSAPSGRAVCEAFTAAMRRYGVPSEVLTDNGAQFTGRRLEPQPVEVLFERICRENGITQRRTKPRSPTTTGKIERFHKTLREEFLDHVAPFESLTAAQQAVDGRIAAYNHHRPHQALDMPTPASLFRPNGPTRLDVPANLDPDPVGGETTSPATLLIDVIEPAPMPSNEGQSNSRFGSRPAARSPWPMHGRR